MRSHNASIGPRSRRQRVRLLLIEYPSDAASPTINISSNQSSDSRLPNCCVGWDTNIQWDQTTRAIGRHSITTGRVEPHLVKTECSPASPKGQHRYLFRGVTDNRRTGASGPKEPMMPCWAHQRQLSYQPKQREGLHTIPPFHPRQTGTPFD